MALIERSALASRVEDALRASPVVTLLGPRQCGKTTLARAIASRRSAVFFDLEDPRSARRLEQPLTALEPLRGLVVIDEVQLRPALLPVLRVLADRQPIPSSRSALLGARTGIRSSKSAVSGARTRIRARFLLLGSASPELVKGSSESLAGRVAFVDMGGFDLDELGSSRLRRLWLRGGFPRSYLAGSEAASLRWREDFVRTFLERDVRLFGVEIPAETLRRLWTMIAHYHGQVWNASEVGRSLGHAHTTVQRHVDLLSGALVVRQLQPWYESLAKRQVKSPKLYVRDSGVLHALLGVPSFAALEAHPKLGASWEGFVVEELARVAGERNLYFWATQAGAELDVLLLAGGRRWGFEVKYADAPGVTRSMRVALADLGLEHLWVVHPGADSYPLDERISALAVAALRDTVESAVRGRRRNTR
jgi:predicted AAA+ superfamily ATPase